MNWRVVMAIFRKDIVDAIKNRYILFVLVLPIGMSLLLNLIFEDPNENNLFKIVVYDRGDSRLVRDLEASSLMEVVRVDAPEQLEQQVKDDAVGGLALPDGFDAAVAAGERPELTVYVNRQQANVEIAGFQRLVEQQLWTLSESELPVRVNLVDLTSPEDSPGFELDRYMLVMFLVMALAMTGGFVVPLLLVEEKEKHTLEVLLVSPAGPAEVVAGKALTGMVYSLLIGGLLITLNQGWTGNWLVTLVAMALGALFMVLLGLLMGGLFHTTTQVNTWASVIILAAIMPSWFVLPDMPDALGRILGIVPTHYLVKVLEKSLAGMAPLRQVWDSLAMLFGSVVVAFAVVVWTLRREDE